MQLHANDPAEGQLGREQDCPAHARTDIDEGCQIERDRRPRFAPAREQRMKYRGSNAVIGGDMAVVRLAGAQMPPRDQPACPHAMGFIPGMRQKAVFLRKAGQKTAAGFSA